MIRGMRTTIRIDDDLLRRAKREAARRGTTLDALIEDALRAALAGRPGSAERKPLRLATFKGKGTLPGVDLDDSAGLLDLMESSHDPD